MAGFSHHRLAAQFAEQRRALPPGGEVKRNYAFRGENGPASFADLFGDKNDLILIHNMGKGCTSCTMWADGFNGVYDHLASRAAFVVSSPNPVAVQKAFAAESITISLIPLRSPRAVIPDRWPASRWP